MARNQEKAQTMLARWLRYKEESVKGPKKRRPYLAELCDDLHEAEKWRGTIIKDISRNVSEIQNTSLGEHRIRDLNDRINKLFREKKHWERRIKNLGGKNYKNSNKSYGGYGHGAYLYFGAAKDLPGVKQLLNDNNNALSFNKNQNSNKNQNNCDRCNGKAKRKRSCMYKLINLDYYGFGDDDDNELFWREKIKEQNARKSKIDSWNKKFNKNNAIINKKRSFLQLQLDDNDKSVQKRKRKRIRMTKILSHVPTREEIDLMILKKRKELLLKKYIGNGDGNTDHSKYLAKQIKIQSIQQQMNNNDDDDNKQSDQNQNNDQTMIDKTDNTDDNDNVDDIPNEDLVDVD